MRNIYLHPLTLTAYLFIAPSQSSGYNWVDSVWYRGEEEEDRGALGWIWRLNCFHRECKKGGAPEEYLSLIEA